MESDERRDIQYMLELFAVLAVGGRGDRWRGAGRIHTCLGAPDLGEKMTKNQRWGVRGGDRRQGQIYS